MDEQGLRELIGAVKAGHVSRRSFVRRMVGLGLTAPFATLLLSRAGIAQAAPKLDYKPTKAGGGGALKTLFWQAPTLLNPHFAVGTKDQEGDRKSTRLNSSHEWISYAVFCLKKKKKKRCTERKPIHP